MLFMGLDGLFGDVPDAAVFADTQGEPRQVYDWLDRIEREVAPFPIHRVTVGDLIADYVDGRRRAAIPAYSTSHAGKPMMMSRFCSVTYKVEAIRRKVRELAGPNGRAESWIGISTDEAHRGFKPSGRLWLTNRYPLLEAGIDRSACREHIVARLGAEPPKSACVFCPFHSEAQWIDLKRNHPEDFARAVAIDERIRDMDNDRWDRPRFLHRSMQPLAQVEFRHENQSRFVFEDAFGNECEGVCGV